MRNYYAGILLLAKEVLARKFPQHDPDILIAANLKPSVGPNGTLAIVPATGATIDFRTIGRRFDDLGIPFDHKLLVGLNRVRNDIEHKFSTLGRTAIIEAIAKGFPAAGQLFRLLDEDPALLLGDEWGEMLRSQDLFRSELAACRESLAKVKWRSATIAERGLICTECGSQLVYQTDGENDDQVDVDFACRACGSALDSEDVIETSVDDALGIDAYLRAKDSGEDGPYFGCPECGKATFIDFEEACANCGFTYQGPGKCAICHETIPVAEMLTDPDRLLCSYHQHLMDKND